MNQSQTTRQSTTEYWVGADVAKDTFEAALAGPGQKFAATELRTLPHQRFDRSPQGVQAFVQWLENLSTGMPTRQVRVVMEATGKYSMELAAWMTALLPTLRPAIVNAYQTAAFIKSLHLRNKTDALEARALAFYGAERQPAAYEPLTPERAALRDLCRHRDALVRQRVTLGNRTEQQAETAFVRRAQERLNKTFIREIAKTEAQMRRLVEKSEDLKRDIALLESIRGVAFLTAAVILAELGDLRRFDRARQVTAFAGLSPRLYQSGSSVMRRPHMCKCGNSRVRQALYLAALAAVRGPGDLQHTYLALVAKGKPRMVALGAIMRKLLIIMRALLIHETTYQPHHANCG